MRKVLGIGAVVFALALSLAVLPGDANAFFGRWRCCGCGYWLRLQLVLLRL